MPEDIQANVDAMIAEAGIATAVEGDGAGEEPQRDFSTLDGLRKAAVFLVSIDEETAAEIMRQLTDDEAKILSKEIMNLGIVDKGDLSRVLHEFQKLINLSDFIKKGGSAHAFTLLKKSFPADVASQIIRTLSREKMDLPFVFMKNLEAETILPFLQNEHPQTIALVLSYVDPSQAAEILGKLSEDLRSEIVKRIATLDQASPEAVKQVESGMRSYLSTLALEEFQEVGGVKSCAEILNSLDRDSQKGILGNLEEAQEGDDDLSGAIKKLMFVFEDVIHVDDRGIQAVLKEVDNRQLAVALKGASKELGDKILGNMSKRAAESIREEISFLGPLKRTDVEASQQAIVDIVRRLEEAGEVSIAGRGGEGEMIE